MKHEIWTWARRRSARVAELQDQLQAVCHARDELLQARTALSSAIEELEASVRPLVRSVLVSDSELDSQP